MEAQIKAEENAKKSPYGIGIGEAEYSQKNLDQDASANEREFNGQIKIIRKRTKYLITVLKHEREICRRSGSLPNTLENDKEKTVKPQVLAFRGVQIKLDSADTIMDIDGNTYHTVKIGNQIWTIENLRTTKYNDGMTIPLVKLGSAWVNLSTPGYCFPNNTINTDRIVIFGALYNWYAVNTGKLAPAGWHVPTDSDWKTMEKYLVLNGYSWDGTTDTAQYAKIAKALSAKTVWPMSTTTGTIGCDLIQNNRTEFSALPCGYRYAKGGFDGQSTNVRWWSATESDGANAWGCDLYYDHDYLYRSSLFDKSCGFSIRLVKD